MQDKVINIKCEAKEYYQLNELTPFQGKLKNIEKKDFDKLKKSLIKDGLPLAFSVWKQKDKVYIMDGHHRQLALKSLSDDGYHIPSLPCVVVEAKTKKEAARTVLISNSKYAKMTQESLSDYMIENELTLDDIEFADIPELNMEDYELETESLNNNDINEYSNKISTPVYEPKKDHAPDMTELFNLDKYNHLVSEINNSNASESVKTFLIHAASRHVVFNYENIAEFYCHQNKEIQNLMENSALIIIDFNKSIENGFIKLTKEIDDNYNINNKDKDN